MKRESKLTIGSIAGLMTLSVGLWGYQMFILPQQEAENYKVVYVAGQDIPTDATIDANMLEPVRVREDSIVPGSVTSIDAAVGSRLTGGLSTGELLFEQRLSDDITEEGQLFVRVEPDYPVDLTDGEHVRVLAQRNGEITELFTRKQVYATNRITNLLDGQNASGFYLLLTEQELENYYHAKFAGNVILSKIDTVATDADISASTGEAINLIPEEESNEETHVSNNRYTVQADQTLEDIAYELEVPVSTLRDLNDGIDSVDEGDVIVIP